MKIYNTLTGKLEEFKTNKDGVVNMYVCGPTIYNYAHIGNMYPVIVFDMIYRYFKYAGYEVNYASNFTDVDDKIIKKAKELGISEKELTEKFIKIYLDDVKSLNCLDIDYRPKVTEHMDEIIDFIGKLLENGYAYKKGDDVYFRVSKIEEYGEISKQIIEELDYGKRIDVSENKENPFDFVLWKKTSEGITWNAPFGEGRPGWHTECVVMINKLFGNNIDIHAGGIELKFPHHENEQAQNRALHGCGLANYWMHNGHITVNGEKMSKSLGNVILVHDLLKEYSTNIIRLCILKNNYHQPLDLNETLFSEVKTIDDKIFNVLKQANLEIQLNGYETGKVKRDEKIDAIMENDFNTSNLITYLLDLVKELNAKLRAKKEFIEEYDKIMLINYILGLKYEFVVLSEEDINLYNKWLEYRNKKDFENADKLRNELIDLIIVLGILIIPTVAQLLVNSTYNKYKNIDNTIDLCGQEVARKMLDDNNLEKIHVVATSGTLSDHYDSAHNVIRLSDDIFNNNTIASVAIAAHECGHAIQDKEGYSFYRIRKMIYPIVRIGTMLSYVIIGIGALAQLLDIIYIGIALVSLGLIFQLVTLPVEFDASRRALKELKRLELINKEEESGVSNMLKAAAFTYVAGVLSSLLELVRLIMAFSNKRD